MRDKFALRHRKLLSEQVARCEVECPAILRVGITPNAARARNEFCFHDCPHEEGFPPDRAGTGCGSNERLPQS